MKQYISAFVLFFIVNVATAQVKFEKGYLITKSNDSINCLIKNIDWRYNPTDFQYKISENSETLTATIADVKEFGVGTFKYRKFTVNIERSYTDANKLAQNRHPEFKQETLFLKTLVEGAATLYVYLDRPLEKYFYEVEGKPIEQLIYIRYLARVGEAAENKQFRQQLYNNVRNVNISEETFKKIEYKQRELVDLFEKFNNISKTVSKKYERVRTVNPFSVSVTAGVAFAKAEIAKAKTSYSQDDKAVDLKKTIIKIGAEVAYILPFNTNKWTVFISPSYQQFESEKSYLTPGLFVTSPSELSTIKIDYSVVEIPIGLRHYFFLNSNTKIFVDGSYVINSTFKDLLTFENDYYILSYNIKSKNNFAFGIGVNYRRFGAAVRFNTFRRIYTIDEKYASTGLTLTYKII